MRIALCLASALAGCASTPSEPQLALPRDTVALHESASIRADGLVPGEELTLTVTRAGPWKAGAVLRSASRWRADAAGEVDTSTDIPIEADWQGQDPFGPFWTAKRVDEEGVRESLREGRVDVAADLDADGKADLRGSFALATGGRGVTEEPLEGFPGAFIVRPEGEDGPLPLIVALGGSGGNDGPSRVAAHNFAPEGYAVLGLPYYSPRYYGREPKFPDLPNAFAELPVDYVEAAVTAARRLPVVDPRRVGLYGVSKGGELVLLAGSLIPETSTGGSFCAIAAVVPSDVVWEGWGQDGPRTSSFSWRGEALPFVPYLGMDEAIASFSSEKRIPLRIPHDEGRAANPDRVEPARIRVGRIDEPVYLLGGDEDMTWASGPMVRAMEATRDEAGLPTRAIVAEEGSHSLSGSPYDRASPSDHAVRKNAWPELINFWEQNLKKSCAGT